MPRVITILPVVAVLAFMAAAADSSQPPASGGTGPDPRKLLTDSQPKVRLRAALALVPQADEQVMGVLIDLLADLLGDERRQAENALRELAGEWSPSPNLAGDDE